MCASPPTTSRTDGARRRSPTSCAAYLRDDLPAVHDPGGLRRLDDFPLHPEQQGRPQPAAARRPRPRPEPSPPSAPTTPLEARAGRRSGATSSARRDVGIDDDFFDLGRPLACSRPGSSRRSSASTGQRLPLSALFEAPTIEELARRYDEAGRAASASTRWTSLIAMQPEGDRPPFFYVSPFLITILSFAHLARYMEPDQPFYLLQPQGMEGDHPVHDRVEDMAAHYISEMRQVQPTGPYRIGGHCAGQLGGVRDGPAAAGRRATRWRCSSRSTPSRPTSTPPARQPLRHVVDRLRSYWRDGRVDGLVALAAAAPPRPLRQPSVRHRRDASGWPQLRYAHAEAHRRYRGRHRSTATSCSSAARTGRIAASKDWHLRGRTSSRASSSSTRSPGSHGDLVENASSRRAGRQDPHRGRPRQPTCARRPLRGRLARWPAELHVGCRLGPWAADRRLRPSARGSGGRSCRPAGGGRGAAGGPAAGRPRPRRRRAARPGPGGSRWPAARSWPAATGGSSSPPKSQMTVRSLKSAAKHRPWSTPQIRSSGPSSTWPLLRSVLLARTSNAPMARSCGWRSGRCS